MEQRLPVCLVRQGKKFSNQYITMLFDQLIRSGAKEIFTLTDMDDTSGTTIPLETGYEGWTSKLEMFAPWNEKYRPFVFFDLDTFILDDISDILDNKGEKLHLIRDFYQNNRSNSGMMIVPKDTNEIWNDFLTCNKMSFRDGDFLNRYPHEILQDKYDGIVSYKADECFNEPKGRIVCFHGKPKPHTGEGWVKEIWDQYEFD